jgi:hypothetical protein
VKNSRISIALLAWAFSMLPYPSNALQGRFQVSGSGDRDHPERGDVTSWVMITLTSAVLVAALLILIGPALEALFSQSMDPARQYGGRRPQRRAAGRAGRYRVMRETLTAVFSSGACQVLHCA